MKFTTAQLLQTASVIALGSIMMLAGIYLLTALIDSPATHLKACYLWIAWTLGLAIFALGRLFRSDKTEESITINHRRKSRHSREQRRQQCPVQKNSLEIARKFGNAASAVIYPKPHHQQRGPLGELTSNRNI